MNNISAVQNIVTTDTMRQSYDLSHWSMQAGAIGSMTSLATIPVIAGDSIELDISSVFRMSPFRRQMYLDALVDIAVFYVKHRHIYGDDDWTNFIRQGFDESVTFGTDTMPAVDANCWALKVNPSAAAPRWLTRGMVYIHNNYYRDPSYAAGELAVDYFPNLSASSEIWNWGLPCCHLKSMSTGTVDSTIATADYRLPLESSEVSLLSLDALRGRLQSEISRDYFSIRYRDVLSHTWGSNVNPDVDRRPELAYRTSQWLSGLDVTGTDDATLGSWVSKAQALIRCKMPSKFIPEHGALWVVALVRFPFVHDKETHYLATKSQPTYAQLAGDPSIVGTQTPVTLNGTDIFIGSGSVDLGEIPHSQWYRTHPSFVHGRYPIVAGHPFLTNNPSDRPNALYIEHDDYDGAFQNYSLKHWNAQSHVGVKAKRFVPDVRRSIFAGTGR